MCICTHTRTAGKMTVIDVDYYVTQSFSVIIQNIVYLRRFPFQAVLTDSSDNKCHKNHYNNFIRL